MTTEKTAECVECVGTGYVTTIVGWQSGEIKSPCPVCKGEGTIQVDSKRSFLEEALLYEDLIEEFKKLDIGFNILMAIQISRQLEAQETLTQNMLSALVDLRPPGSHTLL